MGVGAGLCMYDVVVKKFTFAISSPDEFRVLEQAYSVCNYFMNIKKVAWTLTAKLSIVATFG